MQGFAGLPQTDPSAEQPLCLDFCNTVIYRRSETRRKDWLPDPSALETWLEKHQLGAEADLPLTDQDLERAKVLREAIYGVFSGRDPKVALVAGAIKDALRIVTVEPAETGFRWCLDQGGPFDRALALIALSAAALATSPDFSRVRECDDDDCGWMFVDRSKNKSRRWCSMSECGNLAKARRFQSKKKGS